MEIKEWKVAMRKEIGVVADLVADNNGRERMTDEQKAEIADTWFSQSEASPGGLQKVFEVSVARLKGDAL